MTQSAFNKIAEGLNEALDIARGVSCKGKMHVPPEIDVRSVRAKTGLSQEAFANSFGFSIHQLRQWEQGRCRPLGALRAYLMTIERDHALILRLLTGKASDVKAA